MKKRLMLFLCLGLSALSLYGYHNQKSNNLLVAENGIESLLGSVTSMGSEVVDGMQKMGVMKGIEPLISQAKYYAYALALAYAIIIFQLLIMIFLTFRISCYVKSCAKQCKSNNR